MGLNLVCAMGGRLAEDNAEIFRTVEQFWSKMYIHTISFFSFADLNPVWYAKMIHKESKICFANVFYG
jgi:hypothetical protein